MLTVYKVPKQECNQSYSDRLLRYPKILTLCWTLCNLSTLYMFPLWGLINPYLLNVGPIS